MKLANHFFHTNQESSMQIFKLTFGPRSKENQTFQQKRNLVVQCSVTCALTIYLATGWWSSRQNNLMGPPTHTTWPPRVHHHRPLISISRDILLLLIFLFMITFIFIIISVLLLSMIKKNGFKDSLCWNQNSFSMHNGTVITLIITRSLGTTCAVSHFYLYDIGSLNTANWGVSINT